MMMDGAGSLYPSEVAVCPDTYWQITLHHGQRKQPNTYFPGKSFIQIIMVEGVLLSIVPLMFSDDFLTFYIQIDILHPDVIKTDLMALKMA